ncbi:MAG: hypothetical protein WB567_04480, partial [Terracidiphilus sp.]
MRSRIIGKLFGQDLLNLALILGMAVSIANPMLLPAEFVHDPDVWWHLADARILTTTHHFIHIEPYAFSV